MQKTEKDEGTPIIYEEKHLKNEEPGRYPFALACLKNSEKLTTHKSEKKYGDRSGSLAGMA